MNIAATEEDTVHCHNCVAVVDYHYCAVCGQETRLHVPSAGEFLHEFITHYVAIEGKLWQSLWLLLRRPGLLTAEYLAGRRVRYIQPLRLYLTFSILFFALFKWGGYEVGRSEAAPPSVTRQAVAEKGALAPAAKEEENPLLGPLAQINPKWSAKVEKFDAMSDEDRHQIYASAFFTYSPYAMFCLMPVFAFYLKLLYLGSGRRYGEHLLFALHGNAFAFLMVGLITVVPFEPLKAALVVWLILYLPFAMQRVYGGKRWLTFVRWIVLAAFHVLSMMIAILTAFALAIIS